MSVNLIAAVVALSPESQPRIAEQAFRHLLHCELDEYLDKHPAFAILKDREFYRISDAIMAFIQGVREIPTAPPRVVVSVPDATELHAERFRQLLQTPLTPRQIPQTTERERGIDELDARAWSYSRMASRIYWGVLPTPIPDDF